MFEPTAANILDFQKAIERQRMTFAAFGWALLGLQGKSPDDVDAIRAVEDAARQYRIALEANRQLARDFGLEHLPAQGNG